MAKIIDEKGRMFGKINVIDLICVILLLALVPMIFIGHNIIKAKDSGIPKVFNLSGEEYADYTEHEVKYDALQADYDALKAEVSDLLSEHHRLRKHFSN